MGGQIIVGGGINSVPTLSTIFLILLSLVLFVVSLRLSKNKGAKFFLMLFSVGVLMSATTNIKSLIDVQAAIGSIFLTAPNAGQQEKSFAVPNGTSTIGNNTGFPLQVIRLESNVPSVCSFNGEDICGANSVPFSMPSGATCSVLCDIPTDISGVTYTVEAGPGGQFIRPTGTIDGIDDIIEYFILNGDTVLVNAQNYTFSGSQVFRGIVASFQFKLQGKIQLETTPTF